jgi:uncharacterized protein YggE
MTGEWSTDPAGGGTRFPEEGNANVKQRDSGYLVVCHVSARWSDTEPIGAVTHKMTKRGANRLTSGAYAN